MTLYRKILIGMGVLILALSFLLFRSCESNRIAIAHNEQINDTLRSYIDENGIQVSRIRVLTGESKKTLLSIKSKDSTIVWLQELVKSYKGKLDAAIVLSGTTSSVGSTGTIVSRSDTVYIDSLIYIYPEYYSEWNERWDSGFIRANRDSIHRQVKVHNEYEITLGSVSNGWFKKKTYDVMVKNLNPNTRTEELRSFQVKENPKRISLGIHAGYGLSLSTFQPTPYIGIGVGFNLLGVK